MYGYNAYQKVTHVTQTPRTAEHRLLGNVTAALMAADRTPEDKKKLVDALLWNKKVWDNFVIEVRDNDNQLPEQLRDSLIGIGIWVTQETYRVMDSVSDVKSLIEVNTIIMEGLR